LIVAARAPVHVQTATYFVATTGSDASAGTLTAPWRTIGYAVSRLSAGTVLYVRGGTYPETLAIGSGHASGTSFSNAITVAAYNGEIVTIEKISVTGARRHWIFNDLHVVHNVLDDDAINVGGGEPPGSGAGFIRFNNIDVSGYTGGARSNGSVVQFSNGSIGSNEFLGGRVHDGNWPAPSSRPASHGFYISSPNNLVRGTEIYRIAQWAVHNYSDYPNSNRFEANFIHDCGNVSFLSGGILLSGNSNLAINNILINNANGIHFYDFGGSPTNNRAYNNTVYASGNGRTACASNCYPAVYVGVSQVSAEVVNNLVFGNILSSVGDSGTRSVVATNLAGNPGYVSATAGDFHLQSASPAIDAGTAIAAVPTDYAGVTRPQGARYDIGAYESAGGTAPASPRNFHFVVQ